MKTGWQTLCVLTVGLGATAAFYWSAVSAVHPGVNTGSGRLFVPDISPAELVLTVETGSGSLRKAVKDERTYMELAFDHNDKSLRLAEYMLEVTEDGDFRMLAESMARRTRMDLLQLRAWLKEWYGVEKPLPGRAPMAVALESMAVFDAHRAFLDYELRHHTWTSAMTRIGQTTPLRERMKDFTRYQLRALRLEEDALREVRKRF